MSTVRELLDGATSALRQAGVDTPRLDAELLLSHALCVTRSTLLASLSDPVPLPAAKRFAELVERRAAREPVAYITGWKEFFGRSFRVSRATLIPRPETELLLELALQVAPPEAGVAVDVGTGSGCIAVTLAAEMPAYRVYAVDVSAGALKVARANAELHGVADRVTLLRGALLEPLTERVDLILANLPYVPTGNLAGLEPEVARWEPREALDGGPDGFRVVRELLWQLPRVSLPHSICLLELDPRQVGLLRAEVALQLPGWSVRLHPDLGGRERVAELRPPR
ncbi:MAG: peptide chain release factor N(5)-glutamine methyltransferase [Chloroflexota bacterium]|nr:peptide chain release factor N(5)-glutamine methyltransferase [Chloroflexota bacterium]